MSERSHEPITIDDLARLAELATADRDQLFARNRRLGERYAERVLCVALCQGAALHYVDGHNGVKDFDVWTFYAEHPDGPFPYRRVGRLDFGPSKFGRMPTDIRPYSGRRVDLIGRSLIVGRDADPVATLRHYLAASRTGSARALAAKAVVLIDPAHLRGVTVWPTHPGPTRSPAGRRQLRRLVPQRRRPAVGSRDADASHWLSLSRRAPRRFVGDASRNSEPPAAPTKRANVPASAIRLGEVGQEPAAKPAAIGWVILKSLARFHRATPC